MSKDVLFAGLLALACLILVIVAVFAPKSKEPEPGQPTKVTQVGPENPGNDAFGPPFGGPSNSSGTDQGFGPGHDLSMQGNGPGFGPARPLNPLPPITQPEPTQISIPVEHTVAAGETLGDISLKYFKSSKQWKKIVDANPGLDPKTIKVGQKLRIPAEPKADAPLALGNGPAPVVPVSGERTYTIKANDSLYSIARKELGAPNRWKEIQALNAGVNTADLKVGQVIKLPADTAKTETVGPKQDAAPTGKTYTVVKGDTLADISKKVLGSATKWKELVKANPGVSPENLKIGQKLNVPEASAETATALAAGGYTVKANDTLRSIARAQLGSDKRWKEILDVNPGLNPKALRAGQVLVMPGAAAKPEISPAPVNPAPLVTPNSSSSQSQPFGVPPTGSATPAPNGVQGQPFGTPQPQFGSAQPQPFTPPTTQPDFNGTGANPSANQGFGGPSAPAPGPNDFASPYGNQPFGEPTPVPFR